MFGVWLGTGAPDRDGGDFGWYVLFVSLEGAGVSLEGDGAALEGVEAGLLAEDLRSGLGIAVDVAVTPPGEKLAGQRALAEKVVALPYDVLVFAWIDLTSDAPPAFMHNELYGGTGAFRAGPAVEGFENLMGDFASTTDVGRQQDLAEQIDRFVYEEALSIFFEFLPRAGFFGACTSVPFGTVFSSVAAVVAGAAAGAGPLRRRFRVGCCSSVTSSASLSLLADDFDSGLDSVSSCGADTTVCLNTILVPLA